ncbi:MAG TPA: M1 family aminopeptidase, partial [Fimbriimonas sp.]|nr:M1 family aminopeptidase [Fimbriimonas sp.]
ENVSCTTQTIGALFPATAKPNQDSTGLVAHELAHQWFGDLITTHDWSHIWLNEGWASFLPNFWDRQKYGEERYDLDRLGVFQGGLAAHVAEPDRPMVWTHYEEPIDMFDNYAYPGGASRMFMLMHQVGEDKFWPAITNYLNEYKFKNVTTEQFFASMSKSLGVDLDEFRKQWFYTPAAPSLTVGKNGDAVMIHQGKIPFHLPLDIWLIDDKGTIEKRHVDLPAAPDYEISDVRGRLVLLDPAVWLMANISYDLGYESSDWRRLYDLAPNAAEKERILQASFQSFSLDDKLALARHEKSEAMLERIIPQVPDSDYLVEMTHDPDTRVVAAAVRALGQTTKTQASEDRLREIWTTTTNDTVRQAAFDSLLNLTNDEELANGGLATDSYNEGIRQSAMRWWQAHNPDHARELAIKALQSKQASEPVKLTAMSMLGSLKDKPGEHVAYDLLVSYLKDRSNSPLRTAIGALAEYGDKAAIPLIRARAKHSLHFVRRDVKAALARLGAE